MLVHRQDNARGDMVQTQTIDRLVISQNGGTHHKATAKFHQANIPCIIGNGGIGQKRREGDGITPAGCWKMAYFLYRADRILKPSSALAGYAIKTKDSWCDIPTSNRYNQPLAFTPAGSSEALWRTDNLYDIVIVLDHNTQPAISGQGSAIFIHLSGQNNSHTHGCMAFRKADLLKILSRCGPKTQVLISP